MYNKNLAVAIKVGGKVLKEVKETVYIPFGAEYSIFIKNLNTKRVAIRVQTDGKDVLNGQQLVIEGNESLELERFLGDSLNEGRRFKFIERSGDVERHRGVGVEDGLIRIEFQYEQSRPYVSPIVIPYIARSSEYRRYDYYNPTWTTSSDFNTRFLRNQPSNGLGGEIRASSANYTCDSAEVAYGATASVQSFNDAGITAEGSKSHQRFGTTSLGIMEPETHVMVFQLKGAVGEQVVVAPVTVKSRKYCPSCGRKYDFKMEYCSHDGTYLKTEQFTEKAA